MFMDYTCELNVVLAGDNKKTEVPPAALKVKQFSVDGGRLQSLARLSRPSVFVHRHLHKAAQRGLCVVRNTHMLLSPLTQQV